MSKKKGNLKDVVVTLETMMQAAELEASGMSRTRARILREATKLFQERGYKRVSIDEVARQAGVAKGTVYVHFKSKVELLFQAIREEKKPLAAPFIALLSEELEPGERLRRYVEMMFLALSRSPLASRLMSGDREMLLFLEELPDEQRAELQQLQASSMERLMNGVGAFDRLSASEREERVKTFMGLIYSVGPLLEERVRGGLSVEAYARQLAKIIVHGVGAP